MTVSASQPPSQTAQKPDKPRIRREAADATCSKRDPERPRNRFQRHSELPDELARLGSTGPLAHQMGGVRAPEVAPTVSKVESPPVSAIADRILAGVTSSGEPTVRLELNSGHWSGVDVDLSAGPTGLSVSVFASTAAARRVIQAQLSELADSLAQRGVFTRNISVGVKGDNRRGSRQDARQ